MTDEIPSENLSALERKLGIPKKPARATTPKKTQPRQTPIIARPQPSLGNVADQLREYCRSQVDLWRRVPKLACECDGRSGYSEQYQFAYTDGLWITDGSDHMTRYCAAVDLWTGEFVNLERRASTDSSVMRLACQLDKIDAAAILKELQQDAIAPIWKGYDSAENEAERKKCYRKYIRGTKWDID